MRCNSKVVAFVFQEKSRKQQCWVLTCPTHGLSLLLHIYPGTAWPVVKFEVNAFTWLQGV